MRPDLLERVGNALYGQQWQSALARDLGVSDRTMRRWVAGDTEPPTGVRDDLIRLAHVRLADLKSVIDELLLTAD